MHTLELVRFDSHLDMSTHVSKTCASAFYYLYNIRHIRKYLSRESTERLVHAFITSRLDYCNGFPGTQIFVFHGIKDRWCLLSRQRSAARKAFRFFQLLVAVSRPINVLTELFIANQ